jgi:threonine dehydrogenase-like Zn-dependent dehydrogenase
VRTEAIRLYGKGDLRLEAFDLPPIKHDEILMEVVADSLCMSTWKAVVEGSDHKRVPNDIGQHPIIVGHEMSGTILEVGSRWQSRYSVGERVTIQPALNYRGSMDSPGYSYPYCGGDATRVILPPEVMIQDALLPFTGEGFYKAALSEPYSCVIGACRSLFRTSRTEHVHVLGIKEGGILGIFGGCGPMGLAAVDYAMAGESRPRMIIVTDVDPEKIRRARSIFQPVAEERGIALAFVDVSGLEDEVGTLGQLTDDKLFDDILVMVPSTAVLESADRLLAFNGCLNFFAGPREKDFRALLNYYDVHYFEKHVIGTTGGTVGDQREALSLMDQELIRPEVQITHIGGLDAAVDATLTMPDLPGGKKLIYTHARFPLTALSDLPVLTDVSPLHATLSLMVERSGGLWSTEAEAFFLANAPRIREEVV